MFTTAYMYFSFEFCIIFMKLVVVMFYSYKQLRERQNDMMKLKVSVNLTPKEE